MKKWKLTFRNFRGLDRRTTQAGVSYSEKPTDVGFEYMYWLIKEWVLHPLPAYTSVKSGTWRLFKVGTNMYYMHSSGVDIWNGSSFLPLITQTHDTTDMSLRDIKPFSELITIWAVSMTFSSATDQSITVTDTLPINKYVNKHVIVTNGTVSQTLYITGSDEHTLYTDGLVNWDIAVSWASVNVYDHNLATIVYDWVAVRRYTVTGTSLGTASTIWEWFIEVFANRLFILSWTRVTFSTFYSSIFDNTPFNYINTEWTIVDKQIIGNALVIFTTNGTYALTGTGFTTMNFPKISEFAPSSRVYPVAQIDNTYIMRQWYVRRFTTSEWLLDTQYNYPVIPDTQGKIFAIERWVIFPLWHGTDNYGILNVEEIQNRRLISISNFYDRTITDLLEFKGVIFIISWGVIYKQSGTTNPHFKLNTIRMPNKIFWDTVDISQWGNYPAYIWARIDGTYKVCMKNTWANQVSYGIRNMWYSISIQAETSDPISSFNIYYKY